METIKLDEWYTGYEKVDPYKPPELLRICLSGRLDKGADIKTSHIVKVNGNLITTASGSVYELLTPSQDWIDWLKENNH